MFHHFGNHGAGGIVLLVLAVLVIFALSGNKGSQS